MFASKITVSSPLKTGFHDVAVRRSRPCSFTGDSGVFLAPSGRRQQRVSLSRPIQAMITSRTDEAADARNINGPLVSSSDIKGGIDVRAVVTIRRKMEEKLSEKIEHQWELFMNGIGQGILIQLVSEEIDSVMMSGKSVEARVRGLSPNSSANPNVIEYTADFTVPSDFGKPGAVLVTNLHGKEFYLLEIVIHGFDEGPVFFPGNTWIHSRQDNRDSRIIFRNQSYLPSQTPAGIKDLRREDLLSIRGNRKGERKPHDRIYDYAVYNDLGSPDQDEDLARPVLGGPERPYPRRCRTGRDPSTSDHLSERGVEKPDTVYVPRGETYDKIKQNPSSAGSLKALLHNLLPSIEAKQNEDGNVLRDDDETNGTSAGGCPDDRFAWLQDNEFARQTLAGVNPMNIELLKELPICSKLDPAAYGPRESALTKEVIAQEVERYGMSVEKAIEGKRLFILDYHDMFLPFVEKINALQGRKTYASRTVFFNSMSGILRPLAIELSLPPTPSSSRNKYVYTPGHDASADWIWKLAKAHVCSNDASFHQIVNHWLRTHASMEPYIIATHRQLSSIHPIYKLLHPHMRHTLEINAFTRQHFICGGGSIEAGFAPGKYIMELSSAAYKSMWQFDMEALPADLIRRGMAVDDPSMPCGVKLVIEDYPYAADGLLIWSAIKDLVESYVNHYFSEPNSVTSDIELQAWWDEIKNKGHYDKRNEPWWPKLITKEDLSQILTTMIWLASGQHAAINFGLYPFRGYVPNRSNLMKTLIPQETDPDYEKFLINPQHAFLSSLPVELLATNVTAVQAKVSTHSSNEEFLGDLNQLHRHSGHDHEVLIFFDEFSARLEEIDEIINERNKDIRLKNRNGAGVPPYALLLPTSEEGLTGRGIPNSISI